MLSLPSSVRVFLCLLPTDMRWSFDSLAMQAQGVLAQDPLSGHLFVFRNKRGDRVEILYWDKDGYALWYKRLEAGVFRFPAAQGERIEVSSSELALVLDGIDLRSVKRHKRYARCAVLLIVRTLFFQQEKQARGCNPLSTHWLRR